MSFTSLPYNMISSSSSSSSSSSETLAMATSSDEPGFEALSRLKSADPPRWLAPSSDLSAAARAASRQLFSSLGPYARKSPFEKLLTEGFDAEQIWQQIDLQTRPLIPSLRREVKRLEKAPEDIERLRVSEEGGEASGKVDMEAEGFGDEFDDESDEEEEEEKEESEDTENEDGDEEEEEEGGEDYDSGAEIEDQFLKIKDLEEFMEDDEAREYGLERKDKKIKKKKVDDEEEEEEEEEDDEFGEFGLDGDEEDEEDDKLGNARYEDFFGGKNKKPSKRKSKAIGDSEDSVSDDETERILSTHEKERKKLKSKIEQMEQANLEPKDWTMQGEVTAAKRPKNSALEVDLDFEHNVRPPPVITEEITASLEDMIKNRVLEGQFDDVQKPVALPSKAPREVKELDENKSKKGLAEVYEEEYVQKTNVDYTPLSFADEEKKEASTLFKKLCLKLDALSHFHFTPKPIIEDMSLPENVPALAMEEVAPVAVSDAAMLAPQEVFAGKGDIKDESELTQAERKRRRANKKRKFKAEKAKRTANKPRESKLQNDNDDEAAK